MLEDYNKRDKEIIKIKKTYGIKSYTFPTKKIMTNKNFLKKVKCIIFPEILLSHFLKYSAILRAPDKMGRGVFKDNFFLFLNENICCDPSLEPSR